VSRPTPDLVAPPDPPATADAGGRRGAVLPLRAPGLLGALAAVQAAGLSVLLVVLVAVLAWVAAPQTGATWLEASRIGVDAWLLAHRTGIAVEGGHVGLAPLGLTLLPAVACWTAGRRVTQALVAAAQGAAAQGAAAQGAAAQGAAAQGAAPGAAAVATGVAPRARARALAALTSTYALSAAVLSLLAATPQARPLSGQALLGAAVLSGVAGAAGLWGPAFPGFGRRVRAQAVARAAAVAVGVLLTAAAGVLTLGMLVHHDRVMELHRALDPGVIGGAALTAGQVALLPNAVVWTAAWLAGPGFALGVGTAVTPAATILGPLPAVPLLGVIPPPGAAPAWAAAGLAVPVLAGVAAAWSLRRSPSPGGRLPRRGMVVDALLVAAASGAVLLVLAWVSGGPAGPGRFAHVGPTPWLVGLVVAGEVAAGALGAVLVAPLPTPRDPSRPAAAAAPWGQRLKRQRLKVSIPSWPKFSRRRS
jgi:hypothetical protein